MVITTRSVSFGNFFPRVTPEKIAGVQALSSKSGESSKGSHSEHDEPSGTSEQSSSSTTAKLSKRPDLDGIVGKKKIAVSPERAARPNIQIALSGSKLVYTSEDTWRDASDQVELQSAIHPVLAENINLKKRAELLVRLVAESQYENQQLEAEMKECDEVIKELRRTLGEKIEEEEEEERHEEERDEETGTSF